MIIKRIIALAILIFSLIFLPSFFVGFFMFLFALLFKEPFEAGLLALCIDLVFGFQIVPMVILFVIGALLGPYVRNLLNLPFFEA